MPTFTRSAVVAFHITHRGLDGVLHGHNLTAQVFTAEAVDLDRLHDSMAEASNKITHRPLEDSVGRTFEDVATYFLKAIPGSNKAIIRVPALGHEIEAS